MSDKSIDELRKVKDNWGSYGEKAPDPRSIAKAERLLALLQTRPHICPTVDGGVQFEWDGCEIEIGPGEDDDQILIDEPSLG